MQMQAFDIINLFTYCEPAQRKYDIEDTRKRK